MPTVKSSKRPAPIGDGYVRGIGHAVMDTIQAQTPPGQWADLRMGLEALGRLYERERRRGRPAGQNPNHLVVSQSAFGHEAGFSRQKAARILDKLRQLVFIEFASPPSTGLPWRFILFFLRTDWVPGQQNMTTPSPVASGCLAASGGCSAMQKGGGNGLAQAERGTSQDSLPATMRRSRAGEETKKRLLAKTTPEMDRIGSWFMQAPGTGWTVAEAEAWEPLRSCVQPEDFEALEWYYTTARKRHGDRRYDRMKEDGFWLCRSKAALMNKWSGQVEKAMARKENDRGDGDRPPEMRA